MNVIRSFKVNHDILKPGFYVSREDGDVITYDLRTRKPNDGDYMDNETMHSVEHMFATLIRNSEIGEHVIYFGPMGCQTGFYLIVRNKVAPQYLFEVVKKILAYIVDEEDKMYGCSSRECGNYLTLNILSARVECQRYLDILENSGLSLKYPTALEGI